MTDKKELNIEELDKVSGGTGKVDRFYELKQTYFIEIDKYETAKHINEEMLVWCNGTDGWYLGTILDSYEKSVGCVMTQRTCDLRIIETSDLGETIGGTKSLTLDTCNCYIQAGGVTVIVSK